MLRYEKTTPKATNFDSVYFLSKYFYAKTGFLALPMSSRHTLVLSNTYSQNHGDIHAYVQSFYNITKLAVSERKTVVAW